MLLRVIWEGTTNWRRLDGQLGMRAVSSYSSRSAYLVIPSRDSIRMPKLDLVLQIIWIVQITQTLTLGLTKLGVLLLYKRFVLKSAVETQVLTNWPRIFLGQRFLIMTWTMIVITGLWTSAFFFANLLECRPIAGNWIVDGGECFDTTMMMLSQAWLDVFTDGQSHLVSNKRLAYIVDALGSTYSSDSDTFCQSSRSHRVFRSH